MGRWAVHSSAWGVVGERPRQRGRGGVRPRASRYEGDIYHGRNASQRTIPSTGKPPPPRVFPAAAAVRSYSYLVAKVVLRVDRGEATDGGDVSPGGVVGHLPSGIHLVHEPLPRPVHTHLEQALPRTSKTQSVGRLRVGI